MSTFGHLDGELTLKIAGNEIYLGHVRIPVTGFQDHGSLRLSADTGSLRDAVQELFNQQKEQSDE